MFNIDLLDPIHLENLETQNHFSVFSLHQDYQVLIIRAIDIKTSDLVFYSRSFIFYKQQIYEYKDGVVHDLNLPLVKMDQVLAPIFNKNEKIIQEYGVEIDSLEDSLFERRSSRIFMDNWFDLKKDLARIERYYSRVMSVLASLGKYLSTIESFPHKEFQELVTDMNYIYHHLGNQTSKLDDLHNYYSSIKNDKLNNNLYTLTVISAIFLPLNLVVGFFGMNTENLFFKDNPNATNIVLMILIATLTLSFVGIPIAKIIDKYVLRFILGKSHIYKKVTGKIDKIEQILKID